MSLPWFRMYAEWATDPVVQSLSFDDQRHHAVILCLKCMGALDRDITDTQRERIILRGLGLDAVTANEVKRRLIEVGLIGKDWQPNGWDKRQYSSDVSTKRVRKHRNNKGTGNVSLFYDVTESERFGNAPDTEQNRADTEQKNNSSEPEGSPLAGSPEQDFFIELPLNNGDSYGVQSVHVQEFKKLYPRVDVEQALRSMRAWCLSNPEKRKTKRGVLRFINTWLSREQDRGGNRHETNSRPDTSAVGRVTRATAEKIRSH